MCVTVATIFAVYTLEHYLIKWCICATIIQAFNTQSVPTEPMIPHQCSWRNFLYRPCPFRHRDWSWSTWFITFNESFTFYAGSSKYIKTRSCLFSWFQQVGRSVCKKATVPRMILDFVMSQTRRYHGIISNSNSHLISNDERLWALEAVSFSVSGLLRYSRGIEISTFTSHSSPILGITMNQSPDLESWVVSA